MKKVLSWVFAIMVLTSLFASSAFAAGILGQLYGGLNYKNVVLSPDEKSFPQTATIKWKCSGNLYFAKGNAVLGWIGDFFGADIKNISKVALELYAVKDSTRGPGYPDIEEHKKTLWSKSYDGKQSVEFAQQGEMKLGPGRYKLVLKVKHSATVDLVTICSCNFSVYDNTPQPSYATVTIIHQLTDGTVLKTEEKRLEAGKTHTLYADYPLGNSFRVAGSSSTEVYVKSSGIANSNPVYFVYRRNNNTGTVTTRPPSDPVTPPPVSGGDIYDIGIPNLNGKVYYQGDMNVHVLWVHYQLKATRQYYQDPDLDATGNLGKQTMQEIAKFMKANGYSNHDGRVDQTVVNTLANYLGSRRDALYTGGFYEKMNTLMIGGIEGSMQRVDASSSSTKIKWVQTCLKKLGYYTYSIDGKFGSGTISALNRFQADYGYVQREYVTLGVARRMLEACYSKGYSLNDLP